MVRKSPPLSRQVAQEILTGIQAGDLAQGGGTLPSEAELSQRFAVSRATVREALSQLEQRGLVLRRQGVGTFIAPQPRPIDAGLEELESLETLARRMGLETHMGDPLIEERNATAAEAEVLQLSPDTPILTISRVIMTDSRPIAYLIDIVPTAILRRQDLDEAFRGSVLDLFIRRADLHLSHSRTDILVETADPALAHRLHLRPGEPVLKLQAALYTRDERAIDFSQSYFVPGFFHFHVIRRVGNGNGGSR